jgi:hypothetical protein
VEVQADQSPSATSDLTPAPLWNAAQNCAILNDPFKTIVEAKKKSLSAQNPTIWCRIVDAFQTSAINATNDYKLKDLVKIFSLSGE